MQYKSLKSLLKNIFSAFPVLVIVVVVYGMVHAFPDTERAPATLTEPPLNILSDQPNDFVVTNDNRYVFFAVGNQILKVDLASWELSSDQISALSGTADNEDDPDEGGNIKGIAILGNELFASQDDGDLLIFDLDDLSEAPTLVKLTDTDLGPIVADTEGFQDEDKLYIADVGGHHILVYDRSENSVEFFIPLTNNLGDDVDPVDIDLALVENALDKLYVTTNEGILFSILENSGTATRIESASTSGNDLVAISATPEGDFVLFVDQTDSLIHVLDTSTDTSVVITDVIPVDLQDSNASPRDIVVTRVSNPTDIYAYVAGPEGLTVLDLDITGGSMDDIDILDMDTGGGADDDPLVLTSAPNRVFTASEEYILTVNGNAENSVVTENPFVTITDNSLDGGLLVEGGDFTLTFESDVAGTYSVRLGGGLNADGIELDSGDVPTENTAVTTNTISHTSDFKEGGNDIFVFVTDASGNRGRDLTEVTIDNPPPIVVLNSTGFGDQRVFINFNRLDIEDISHYNLYVATDASTALGKAEVDATADQPGSGSQVTGTIAGLTNGTTYFIAVEAVDEGGAVGPRNGTLDNGVQASAIPQKTVGLVGRTGETGCQLLRMSTNRTQGVAWLSLAFIILLLGSLRCRLWPRLFSLHLFLLAGLFFFSATGSVAAEETSPQWFSFEIKTGNFIPTNGTTKDALSKCCNLRTEIEFGFLYDSKYGVELGTGFLIVNRTAIGSVTNVGSQDRFNFMLIPMQLNLTYRADYKENQLLVPFVKVGPDVVFFRENIQGSVTKGLKYGLHGTAGLQILLEFWGEGEAMERMGVNDVYFIVEGEYAWINSFGASGLDLSGFTVSGGLLFEF